MVSSKVRKQLVFVNACRRRLKKMMIENGDADAAEDSSSGKMAFPQLVEDLRMALEDISKLKEEVAKLRNKNDGNAVRKRQEFNSEVARAKGILSKMRESLQPLQKKLVKAEKSGKTENEKYQERKREYNAKDSLISSLVTELEKLEWKEEFEMSGKDGAAMDAARAQIRAVRQAKRRELMRGATDPSDDAPAAQSPLDEDDPEFEAAQKQIEQNRREQEVILGRLQKGLGTLKEQARNIGSQIDQSNHRLEDLETKADTAKGELKSLNKSMIRALDEVSTQSYFTNIACFLFLLALCGVAVYYLDLV